MCAMAKGEKKSGGGKVVLVGTYKGDQLTKWRGWYNYPISEDEFHAEAQRRRAGGSRLSRPTTATDVASANLSTFQPFNFSTRHRTVVFQRHEGRTSLQGEVCRRQDAAGAD